MSEIDLLKIERDLIGRWQNDDNWIFFNGNSTDSKRGTIHHGLIENQTYYTLCEYIIAKDRFGTLSLVVFEPNAANPEVRLRYYEIIDLNLLERRLILNSDKGEPVTFYKG